MNRLTFSLRQFKWEFRESVVTENVGTWEYFNKGIYSVFFCSLGKAQKHI